MPDLNEERKIQTVAEALNGHTVLSDYWFDWKAYHPDTAVYKLGAR